MDEILKEITNPPWRRARFWITAVFFLALIVYFIYFKFVLVDKGLSADELKASVEFFNISSQWIEKEKIEDKDFKGIVMVPQISFQIRNKGQKVMKNIYILGVFRRLYVGKSMGEGFKIAMKKGVQPGKSSSLIVINSSFGYRVSSKESFQKGVSEWGKSLVELYIKSSVSKLFFIKSFYIRQVIEGMSKEVRIQ